MDVLPRVSILDSDGNYRQARCQSWQFFFEVFVGGHLALHKSTEDMAHTPVGLLVCGLIIARSCSRADFSVWLYILAIPR